MFCQNCGSQNDNTSKFCLKCGSQMPVVDNSMNMQQPQQVVDNNAQQGQANPIHQEFGNPNQQLNQQPMQQPMNNQLDCQH